jgi:hypothetical protein
LTFTHTLGIIGPRPFIDDGILAARGCPARSGKGERVEKERAYGAKATADRRQGLSAPRFTSVSATLQRVQGAGPCPPERCP